MRVGTQVAIRHEYRPFCCHSFVQATQDGTDNEAWGTLINAEDIGGFRWVMGAGLEPLRFCPWCGAKADDGTGITP